MNIERDVPLAPLTAFRSGGMARFFARAEAPEEVLEAARFAEQQGVPVFPLGQGTNILIGDRGVDALVLHVAVTGISFAETEGGLTGRAAAGEAWDSFVEASVHEGFRGLENLSGIPGTVGGAVVGNIGAYGAEVKDSLVSAETMDLSTGSIVRMPLPLLSYGYRTSALKGSRTRIVLSAEFALSRGGPANLSYAGLRQRCVDEDASPSVVREAVLSIRAEKLPDWRKVPTAGSFFKNPVISQEAHAALLARYPGMPGFPSGAGMVKVPAGWLIDHVCGMKGVSDGAVGTWKDQALVIVNRGGASSVEIASFARRIRDAVEEKTGIVLEPEVESVGDF